ncbi:MAG TPA: DivIVA domain-containing protein [Chitinivibrionales bacterium]|jgi:cell division initiation protein|nr:DivIVA domain-containing protein [Chitinivibrionales bacterium]
MHLTPLDIRKMPFRHTLSGFDRDQVNTFLEQVANEYEKIIRENDEFTTRIKHLEEKLDHYVKIEQTLSDTLVTAQKATDEARLNAQKEAELILKDAQVRAGRYEDDSRRRVHDLESEIISLKTQRDSFLARFRAMLKTQLELLSVISDDLSGGAAGGRISDTSTVGEETLDEIPSRPDIAQGMDL